MELLQGNRFAVASYGVAAAYAGWLLRQFGADVAHVSALDPEGIGAFLGEGASFAAAPSLDAEPGVTLITDAPATPRNRETLESRAASGGPVVWITPWGLETPWTGRPASDLVLHAAGGWMCSVGDPGREPLGPPGAQGQFVGGLFATIAALSGVADGAASRGIVDVPLVEAVAATMIYDSVAFQYFGLIRGRVGNRFARSQPTLVTLPCKDGYVGIHAALHSQWVTLTKLIGHPELVSDPRFASPADRAVNIADLDTYFLPWLAERTRFEVFHTLQAARIPSAAIPTLDEVLASPQLDARKAWRLVRTPSGRTYTVPGAPARVLTETDGGSRRTTAGPWRPGALRVVDLSMGWAGPLVSYILSALGADVIKVESHTHFDWWRGSRPPGDDPALALHEHSHVFNAANRGKRGITLNLATPRGAQLARELIAQADVVVENFGAGVLERLGLDFASLARENPGLIMLRQPGFGSDGPEAGYVAFGNTIEGMSGLTALMGYEGGPPMMMSNAFGDPVSGLIGTVAVLSALAARERDGRGRLVECAQLEGFLPLVSEALIAYQASGRLPERLGNRRAGSFVSGAFLAAGDDDRWLALDLRTPGDLRRLAEALGEDFDGLPPGDESAAHQAVAAWARARPRDDFLACCQHAAVPSAPVHDEAELLTADVLGPGFWAGEERAHVGFHLYPSLPLIAAGERLATPCAAPTLGQHTAEVLVGLGLSAAELDSLRREDVVGETPAA